MKTLPSWMFADPADVAERLELGEQRRAQRVHRADPSALRVQSLRPRCGMLSAATLRLINRARIRELMAKVTGRPK